MPALKFRNHARHEIVEPARQPGKHVVEAIRAALIKPAVHLVSDSFRRADEGQAGVAAGPRRKLADGQVLGACDSDDALAGALAGVGFGDLWQRSVRIEPRDVMAQHAVQRGNAAVIVDEAVGMGALGAGFLDATADNSKRRWQDLDTVRGATDAGHAGMDVGNEALAAIECALGSKDDFGSFGGKLAPGFRRPGLDDDRPALRRPGDIERPRTLRLGPLWPRTCRRAGSK